MAETRERKPPKRQPSLTIIEKNSVSKSEAVFHELSVEGIGEGGNAGSRDSWASGGSPRGGSPRGSWARVAAAVNFISSVQTASAPPEEEGGSLGLSSVDFRVGMSHRFKVHLEQLEGKTLIITCDPPEGASVKIATQTGEGVVTYLCTITPLKEGSFIISALFGRKHVLGSPFDVTFNPPADATLCTIEEAPEECRTSVDKDTLTFCVHTNQEREGTLTASVKSLMSKKTVPVSVSQVGLDHYDVEFDAVDGKKYRLAVKFDNQHVNGSPFFIHLSDPSLCQASGKGLTHAIAGYENQFEVATKGAGPGELRVMIEGKANLVPTLESKDNDTFVVKYTPKKAGSYSITVLWMDDEIPESPFLVTCYKPPSITVPKPDKHGIYLIGETYKFKVDTKEAGEGELEASCSVPDGSANVEVVSKGGGHYRVLVTPLASGVLPVSIRWAEVEVPGSPFELEAEDKANPSLVATSELSYEVGSSRPVVLEVNTEKGGAGKLKATCVGERSGSVNVKVVQTQPKLHFVSFDPPRPDIYSLWVTWSKQQIPGSPFRINLHPPNALSCSIVGAPEVPVDWQQPAVLTINTAGAGNGKLEVKAEGEASGAVAEECLEVWETQAEVVQVSLRAPVQDIYSLSVTWGGEEIPKSPVRLNRIPPDASKCIASPPQFGRDWASPVLIHIDATQAGNGKLKALVIGGHAGDVSECAEIQATSGQLDHYDISFTAPAPDYYTLTAEWNGEPIPGFPVRLNQNQFQPQEVEVVEPPAGHLKVGQDISLGVDASQGGHGELTAECKGQKTDSIAVNVEKKEGERERYKVFFTPPAEDVYSLSILWGGRDIKGSPFTIDLIPVNASLVKASDPTHPQGLEGPVEVTLSAEETGKAPVSAICMGGKSGRVLVSVKQLSYSQYLLSFTPPQPDLFTMGVKYGTQNIKNSPFYINTYPPDASQVRVMPPEEMLVGQAVSYLCDASNAGHGKLSATARGKKTDSTDLEMSQTGVAKFTASFVPQVEDIYYVFIRWEQREVPGSPFLVNLQPLNASLVAVEDVHVPEEAGLEYASVTINCSDVGQASVTANVIGGLVGGVATEVEPLPDFRHCVKFVPLKDDTYNLSIFYNDEDIPGSPFIMSIVSPQPDKVRLLSTHIPNQPSPSVCLSFDASEAGKGGLQATIVGQKCGDIREYEVKEEGGGTWKVSFIPPSPDSFTVSCSWARRSIPQSPFKVDMGPPMASRVAVTELHIPEDAGTGEEAWVSLDCTAAGHGVVWGEVEEKSSFGNSQEAEVEGTGFRRYRVKFNPRDPGLYTFSVRYGRDHVTGSPFVVDLQPAWPERVRVVEKDLPEFSDGSSACVTLSTADAGRGQLTASLRGEICGEVPLTLEEVSSKTFRISFTPPTPDSYSLDVYWSDLPISSSPISFNVLLPICPEKVVCGDLKCPAPRKLAALNVSTAGAGHAHLTASCVGEKCGEVEVSVEAAEEDVDRHTVSFTPLREDVYMLSVYYSGTAVPGSPFTLDLVPRDLIDETFSENFLVAPVVELGVERGEEGEQEEEEGGGGKEVQEEMSENVLTQFLGDPLTISVTAEEEEEGEGVVVVATATGEKTGRADVTVTKTPEGYYDVIFDPEAPDYYTINVLLNDAHIPGSPFKVIYEHRTNPYKCFVFDCDDISLPLRVGHEVNFGVDATAAGISTLKVTVDGPSRKTQNLIQVTEVESQVYHISYTPTASGLHRVHLKWANTYIPGSPIELRVGEGPGIPIYRHGAPVTLQLKATASLSDLAATAMHMKSKAKYDVEINQVKSREFQLRFTTSKPGMYSVNVYLRGTEITGSPYYIRYAPPSDPSACVLSHFHNVGYIGQMMEFILDTSNAGFGDLSVRAAVPKTGLRSSVNIKDNRDGTYLVQYTPQALGEHLLHLHWSEEAIPGSPFSVRVEEREEGAAKEVGLVHLVEGDESVFQEPHPIEQPLKFTISTANAGPGRLAFSSHGPGKPAIRVQDNKDHTFTCFLVSEEPGEYQIDVLWSGRHIQGSPFPLTLLPSKAIKVLGLNVSSDPGRGASSVQVMEEDQCVFRGPCSLGRGVEFRLATGNAGQGELTVSCVGPGRPEVSVWESEEGTHTCRLVPSEIGDYKVFVLWNKLHIPGSPFSLCCLPSKAVQMLGLNPEGSAGQASNVSIVEEDRIVFSEPQPLRPVEFGILTASGGKGELCVSAKGPGEITVEMLESTIEGTQTCQLTPSAAGEYCVYVQWNKVHIPGSPFLLTCLPPKAFQLLGLRQDSCPGQACNVAIAEEDRLRFSEPQPLQAVEFGILTAGGRKGELCVSAKGRGDITVEMLESKSEGTQTCRLTPSAAGEYVVYVLWNRVHIPGSPFAVRFASEKARKFLGLSSYVKEEAESPEPDTVHVVPGDRKIFKSPQPLGNAVVFRMSTARAGKGVLTITAQGPGKPEVKVESTGGGVYSCSLLATIAGRYLVHVLWNKEPVVGSPYVLVFQSNLPQITGLSLENAVLQLGLAHRFRVFYGDVGEGSLQISSRPSDVADITVSPVPEEAYYQCQLIPRVPGNHTLLVQYNNEDILGSPFCVHFDPNTTPTHPLITSTPAVPHNVEVYGPGLEDGFVGQEGNFVIETTRAGKGQLDIEVSGPCGGFKVQIRQHWENEQMLLARYDPMHAGTYHVVIRWAGVEVPGSPFTVRIAEQADTERGQQPPASGECSMGGGAVASMRVAYLHTSLSLVCNTQTRMVRV